MNKVSKLSGRTRFQPADFNVLRFAAVVPSGTTMADITDPEYFANHLDRMKPGMEITVISDDYALDAVVRVLTVTKTTANLRVLNVYAEPDASEANDQDKDKDIKASWGGPSQKWRVTHGENVVDQGFASKEEAQAAADAYADRVSKGN